MNSYEPVWLVFVPLTGKKIIPVSDQKRVFNSQIVYPKQKIHFEYFETASLACDYKYYTGGKNATKAYKVYTLTDTEFGRFGKNGNTIFSDEKDLLAVLTDKQKCRWTYFGNISKLY